MSDLEKIFRITPAHDTRPPLIADASGNLIRDPHATDYGIHCCDLFLALKGPKGAVSFMMTTGWYLPDTRQQFAMQDMELMTRPTAADISVHGYDPLYFKDSSWVHIVNDSCQLLDGKKCHLITSGLNAAPVMDLLITKGLDEVWKYLENYYNENLGNERL